MLKRFFTTINNAPITITTNAWNKMSEIIKTTKYNDFIFSTTSGGCNGFNYNLDLLDNKTFDGRKIQSKYVDETEFNKFNG